MVLLLATLPQRFAHYSRVQRRGQLVHVCARARTRALELNHATEADYTRCGHEAERSTRSLTRWEAVGHSGGGEGSEALGSRFRTVPGLPPGLPGRHHQPGLLL